jgi:hypothetical protein
MGPPALVARVVAVGCLCMGALVVGAASAGASTATPSVTITPGPSKGAFTSGQTVTVSVGPNSLFVPLTRVNILECADPGGTAANLPTSLNTCDAITIQGDSVIVQANGSFVEHSYQLFSLPSAALGEQANWQPVCNATHTCVLYVGENQDDFTQPKIFSRPFTITPSAADPSAVPSAVGGAVTTTTDPSAAVSLPAATLAFTGVPTGVVWMAALGVGLVGVGLAGRRLLLRRLTRKGGS